jgi:hypothetical protein
MRRYQAALMTPWRTGAGRVSFGACRPIAAYDAVMSARLAELGLR